MLDNRAVDSDRRVSRVEVGESVEFSVGSVVVVETPLGEPTSERGDLTRMDVPVILNWLPERRILPRIEVGADDRLPFLRS